MHHLSVSLMQASVAARVLLVISCMAMQCTYWPCPVIRRLAYIRVLQACGFSIRECSSVSLCGLFGVLRAKWKFCIVRAGRARRLGRDAAAVDVVLVPVRDRCRR